MVARRWLANVMQLFSSLHPAICASTRTAATLQVRVTEQGPASARPTGTLHDYLRRGAALGLRPADWQQPTDHSTCCMVETCHGQLLSLRLCSSWTAAWCEPAWEALAQFNQACTCGTGRRAAAHQISSHGAILPLRFCLCKLLLSCFWPEPALEQPPTSGSASDQQLAQANLHQCTQQESAAPASSAALAPHLLPVQDVEGLLL